MNPASSIASAIAAVVCLSLITSCKGDRSPDAASSAAPSPPPLMAEVAPAPSTLHPTTPLEGRFDVRCERVLSAELREKHMYGWPMTESAGPDRATCTFDEEPFKRIIVSFDCRQPATSEARLAAVREVLERAGHKEAPSPGRLAFVTKEGVPTTFWDDDTECEVTVDRVGWNEPDAASIVRAHAVAEALTAASIAR
jgi:hypothetical protein